MVTGTATGTVFVYPWKMETLNSLSPAEKGAIEGLVLSDEEPLVHVWCLYEYRGRTFGGPETGSFRFLPLRFLEGVKEGEEIEFEFGGRRLYIRAYQRGANRYILRVTGSNRLEDVLEMAPRP